MTSFSTVREPDPSWLATRLLASVAAAFLLGAGAQALSAGLLAAPPPAASAVSAAPESLPQEWVWRKAAIGFEGMHRSSR